ncbi:Maf family protein [Lawsonibacter sp. LCP25S3_F5]
MAMILASQSPRRRELLGQMGFSFTVRPAKGEELPHPELTPAQLVEELARQKALEVSAEAEADDVVVAADTVVAIDGKVLGKPHDKVHAAQMLSALSGREHTVYTGVAVKRGETLLVEHEATQVRFRPLTEREIDLYIQTGEPMDKAGSYGIQGYGALLVEGIRGDYFNVVGLPICRLGRMLAQVGEDALAQCAQKCAEKER